MPRCYPLIVLAVLLFAGCSSPQDGEGPLPSSPNKFSDSTFVRIHEAQDRRDAATLQGFLSSEKAEYRAAAAEAFGSVQDSGSIELLIPLLLEENVEVAAAAAWALGQTGKASAALDMLDRWGEGGEGRVGLTLGEAIGKCGDSTHLADLLKAGKASRFYAPGAMQGLYRAGLRGLAGPETADFAVQQLQSGDSATQLYAAAFLGRNRKLGPITDPVPLIQALHEIKDPDILQHLVKAFGRAEGEQVAAELRSLLETATTDYRVKISAIRAMNDAPSEEYLPLIQELAKGENEHVAFEAANYLKAHTPPKILERNGLKFLSLAEEAKHWRTKATLVAAAIRVMIRTSNTLDIETAEYTALMNFKNASNEYEKGAYLMAMAESWRMERTIAKELESGSQLVRNYAIGALAEIYRDTPKNYAKKRIEVLKSALLMNDVGVTAQVAALIRQEKMLQEAAGDGEFLEAALGKLVLPQDIETYNEIERTLAAIRGNDKPVLKTVEFNNPIDWEFVKTIPRDQKAIMKLASGGEIHLQLLVEKAPGTVANFVRAAKEYYQNAIFHRVVPNFVAQGGDPRGDGWGSSANTIRSEWPSLHYGEGYMGMASAGKDTESIEWFITHCSTPHLDGRYTIFAKVISGMEYLHQVNIGDQVTEITFPGLDLSTHE